MHCRRTLFAIYLLRIARIAREVDYGVPHAMQILVEDVKGVEVISELHFAQAWDQVVAPSRRVCRSRQEESAPHPQHRPAHKPNQQPHYNGMIN
jgi:hypothetical protein